MRNPVKIFIVVLSVVVLIVVVFGAILLYPIFRMAHYTKQLEQSIQTEWKTFTNLSVLDTAIKSYGTDQGNFDIKHLDIPLSAKVSTYYIYRDSISIEYGGGFHHFGISYYLDNQEAEKALKEDSDNRRLNDRLLFYSETK